MRQRIADGAVAALATAAMAAAGCGTTSLTTDYDKRARFDQYESYAIKPGPVVTDGAVTAVPDQLAQDRISAMLGKELTTKGFSPAQLDAADLIVTYAARADEYREVIEDEFGLDPWPFNSNLWVESYRQATLIVDVLDATTGRRVWRTTAQTKNEDFHDPQFVAKIVDRAMRDFPRVERL